MEKLDNMKPGIIFKNGSMELTVIEFYQNEKSNVIFVESNEGLYITARNLSRWKNGYTWDWGHYFSKQSFQAAKKDYNTRKEEI